MRVSRFGSLLATVVLVAACGGGASPAPATPAPATPAPATPAASAAPPSSGPTVAPTVAGPGAPESTTLRVVQGSDPDFTQIALTKAIELMKAKGVNVEFSSVADTDTATRSVIAGVQDIVVNSLYFGINAVKSGIPMKTIMVESQSTDYLLMAGPNFTGTVTDLVGKKLAINKPGDLGSTISYQCLKGSGVDPATVPTVQVGGTSARLAAVLSGQVDAALAHVAEALNAQAKSGLKMLVNCGKMIGSFLQTGVNSTDSWLAAHPNLAQMWVDSYIDAERWAATDKEGYITLSKQVIPDISDDLRGPAYDQLKASGIFAVNGGLTPAAIEKLITLGLDSKSIESPVPDNWYTMTYVESYLARNGSV